MAGSIALKIVAKERFCDVSTSLPRASRDHGQSPHPPPPHTVSLSPRLVPCDNRDARAEQHTYGSVRSRRRLWPNCLRGQNEKKTRGKKRRKKRGNRRLAGRASYGETNLCPACDIVEHRAAVTGNSARPTCPLWFAILFSLISQGFEGFRLRYTGGERESVRVREAPCEGVPEPCTWLVPPCADPRAHPPATWDCTGAHGQWCFLPKASARLYAVTRHTEGICSWGPIRACSGGEGGSVTPARAHCSSAAYWPRVNWVRGP